MRKRANPGGSILPVGGDCHVAAWVWIDTGGIFWASRMTSKHQAECTIREWEKRGSAPKGISYEVLQMGVVSDLSAVERLSYWKGRALRAEAINKNSEASISRVSCRHQERGAA